MKMKVGGRYEDDRRSATVVGFVFAFTGPTSAQTFKTGYFSKDLNYLPLFIASCQFNNINSNPALG